MADIMNDYYMLVSLNKLKGAFLIPPEYIPDTTPNASSKPIIIKGNFGEASISSVALPARYLTKSTEKYIATYLFFTHNHNLLVSVESCY